MLNQLKPVEGSKKNRKRLGRGAGSGTGKTSGKGHKGQKARSGGGVRPGFEGGQLPLFQSIPKRGFRNVNRKEYAVVNLDKLNVFKENEIINLDKLIEMKVIKKRLSGLKILANGKINKPLTIQANKFSNMEAKQLKVSCRLCRKWAARSERATWLVPADLVTLK